MVKLLKPSNQIIEQAWKAAFPNESLPPVQEYKQGGRHHVVLLGEVQNEWQFMLRWNEEDQSAYETARLKYLSSFSPPVKIPAPILSVEIDQSSPFNRCEILSPVSGFPLHEYLKRETDEGKRNTIAKSLGEFIYWMNQLPFNPEYIAETSVQVKEVIGGKDESLRRLKVAGLTEKQADYIFEELLALMVHKLSFAPCHNDIYPQHILVNSRDELGIIDWDDMGLNYPVRDFTMWYEPFDNHTVYKNNYPEMFRATAQAYRRDFPNVDEERKLKLYALAGELAYDGDETGNHVKDWLKYYRHDFF